MKKFFVVFAMLLFATPLLAQDQTAAPADNTAAPADTTAAAPVKHMKKAKATKAGGDEAGIKKAFAQVSEAWNAGDAEKVASFFTEDGSLVNPMGMEGHGRAGVQQVIEGEFAGPMKGTQQTFDDFEFTWVMPNFALVDCTAMVTGMKKPDGTDADSMKVHVYGAIVNRGKGWKARSIRAFAVLMPPSAEAPAAATDASTTPVADKAAPSKATDTKTDMNK